MERTIVRDGLRLAFDVSGPGADADDVPVVLLHGLGFTRRSWKAQREILGGRCVVTPDLRGFGDSQMPSDDYDMAALAGDLEAVRVALGAETIDLVGHSMGGMVAQSYVLAHPERVRSLMLASTTSHNGKRASAFARAMSELSREGFDAAKASDRWPSIEQTIAAVVPYTGPVMKLLRSLTKEPSPARSFAWRAISRFTVKDRLAEIACPTTVMHGTHDANIPFNNGRLLAEAIAHAHWIAVDGARHNLPLELTDAFNEALLTHLTA